MDMTSFLIYCVIATFTPGPTNLVILSTVNHFGAKQAMQYSYGAAAGFGLLLVISAVLNNLLLTVIPKIVIAMQVVGSIYMLYLAYLMCKSDSSNPAGNQTATFLSGFMMQFLNPKVVLFSWTVGKKGIVRFSTPIVYDHRLGERVVSLSKAILGDKDEALCSEMPTWNKSSSWMRYVQSLLYPNFNLSGYLRLILEFPLTNTSLIAR
ncbi:LysE family translocator [Paenibacillus sp. OAS669]|uniref:LysE family translocator n=1 Tax=Paenibacillus sp. OAS669 TaxID=2663821 RepID=UPI00178BEF6E|nr:LysE family translocator [Paenibacillus sp. OAS669]MBE1442509.1 chromate transport protein ChrA [Paenibacillus sp. OAS669]